MGKQNGGGPLLATRYSLLAYFSRRGQVMIEAIVASSVLVVGFLGMFSLLSRSFFLNRVVTDNYRGANLASEGIEIVKNMLDHNAVASILPWNAGFLNGQYEADYGSLALSPYSGQFLLYNPATGLYGYAVGGSATTFVRKITITFVGQDEMIVDSNVIWSTGAVQSNMTVEDEFFNWRP